MYKIKLPFYSWESRAVQKRIAFGTAHGRFAFPLSYQTERETISERIRIVLDFPVQLQHLLVSGKADPLIAVCTMNAHSAA